MESTASKPEVLKPVILKAGVPLAVTLAGFIYTWIMAKKSLSKASSLSTNEANSTENKSHQENKGEESCHSLASIEDEAQTAPMHDSVLAGSSVIHDTSCLEQEISGLRSQIEGMQMRELASRLRFDEYCDLKEQECVIGEIRNTLSMETARVEFLDREISSVETENRRLENLIVQYLRVVEQVEYWKSERRMLQRKFHKLMRKSKAQSRLVKEQALKIKVEEAEILRCHDALQKRINVIDKLEDEIRVLQSALLQLQDQKTELLKKLDTAEKSYASKIEAGDVSREDYNQIVDELEQMKKEQADEAKELIYLRWTNACLRHKLTRHHEQQNQDRDQYHTEQEPGGNDEVVHYDLEHESHDDSLLEHHNVPPFDAVHHHSNNSASSKRRKLLKRLKKWVEGSEKGKS